MRSGVILAGGRSTRFGDRDKALEPLAGTSMTRRVADRIATVTDEVVVNCRADQESGVRSTMDGASYPVKVAVDPVPDLGPVGGIKTGLEAAAGEYSAVVACDMPFVDPSFLAYLFERASGHDGAVPRPTEYFEVTQAVYRTGVMVSACERALETEHPRVLVPLEYLDVVVVEGEAVETHTDSRTFRNVNTRAEFDEVAELLAAADDEEESGK